MGEFANRADWESRLQRALEKLQKQQLQRLLESLGDPPNLANLHPDFWNEFSTEYREALYPLLEGIFLDGAAQRLDASTIGVDWDLVNEAAARWARQYTFDLVSGITDHSQQALREKVGGYWETPTSLGALTDSLAQLFGPVRAEMIAITETTRAAVNGQIELVHQLGAQGVEMVAVWQTNNDDIVCPLCGPRNQQRQFTNWSEPPPAHPRCRCWIDFEFADGNG